MKRLTHEQVWTAIDRLASRYGYSASGLAKKAGLDATSFNKSKRVAGDGHHRWPSTESLAKVLDATGASVDEFIALLDAEGLRRPQFRMPLIGSVHAATKRLLFDGEGQPLGEGWDELNVPGIDDANAFAVEVSDSAFEPMYRQGDRLVLSPGESLRPRDRVLICLTSGSLMACELKRSTAKTVEVKAMRAGAADLTLPSESIAWIARIVWASQ
jgi:phage repressor protein C with HTH and peptisase S24 domain